MLLSADLIAVDNGVKTPSRRDVPITVIESNMAMLIVPTMRPYSIIVAPD